jgi:hypothetical protein
MCVYMCVCVCVCVCVCMYIRLAIANNLKQSQTPAARVQAVHTQGAWKKGSGVEEALVGTEGQRLHASLHLCAAHLHTSAYISIRQSTAAYGSILSMPSLHTSAYVSIRSLPSQHRLRILLRISLLI